jgi:hypothetical protein
MGLALMSGAAALVISVNTRCVGGRRGIVTKGKTDRAQRVGFSLNVVEKNFKKWFVASIARYELLLTPCQAGA